MIDIAFGKRFRNVGIVTINRNDLEPEEFEAWLLKNKRKSSDINQLDEAYDELFAVH